MTMMTLSLRPGWRHAIAALMIAAVVATMVVSVSPLTSEIGGRLALGTFGFFALALAIGSRGLVGIASIPMLAAVLAASPRSDPGLLRSIVIGCLWYVAVEMAWESIEVRTGGVRSTAVGRRRTNEVAFVVTLALGITTAGLLLSELAPQRTLITQGTVVLAIMIVLALLTRRLESDPQMHPSSGNPPEQIGER